MPDVSIRDGKMTPTSIAGYLALFSIFGFVFLFANLLVGRFLRPNDPTEEKKEIYECGEPTIGSSFVQFDLRFYVVALLFIIFDVEVAFFFPWATVFGKATHLMDPHLPVVAVAEASDSQPWRLDPIAASVYEEMGVPAAAMPRPSANASRAENANAIRRPAVLLAYTSVADIVVFFAVLLVGFAYVWRRGDLDWVRAVSAERARASSSEETDRDLEDEPMLVG